MASYIVNPEVAKLFDGRTFTWVGSNPLAWYMQEKLGLPRSSQVIEQGTISACLPSLADLWGCKKVCLVGQDLAVRPDGQTHTKDSFYTDTHYPEVDFSRCKKMDGNTCSEVFVEEKLYVYLDTFRQLTQHFKNISFINTSVHGVKIEGAPYKGY